MQGRWTCRARHGWRILGRLLHRIVRGAGGRSAGLLFGIGDVGGDGVAAAGNSVGVDARSVVLASNFSAGTAPCVVQRVFGVEVRGSGSGRDGLAYHDFAGLHGATRGWRHQLRIAKVKHQAGAQPHAAQRDSPEIGECRGHYRRIVLPGPYVIGLEHPPIEFLSEAQIHSAAQNRANAIPIGQTVYIEPVVAQQSMQKIVGIARPESQLGSGRESGFVVIPVVPEVAFQSQVLMEVVSDGCTKTLGHIWNFQSRWIVVVTEWGWNSAAGMQPLIPHEDFILRGFGVLG